MLEEKWVSIPLEGTAMEKLNLNLFYQLGSCLNHIAKMNIDDVGKVYNFSLYVDKVKISIELLRDAFPDLIFCKDDANELLSSINDLYQWLENTRRDRYANWGGEMDNKGKQIIINAQKFEPVLLAEIQKLEAFHITRKMGYGALALISHFEETFSDTTRCKLDEDVIEEIRQGGRCLAFDCYTAFGFHIMRATEAVVHQYYIVVCKPASQKPLDNWGAYISALRKIEDDDVKKVIALLQQIKDIDRNPIMHPEWVLTQDESTEVFDSAKAAIAAMAKRLPELKKKMKHAQ